MESKKWKKGLTSGEKREILRAVVEMKHYVTSKRGRFPVKSDCFCALLSCLKKNDEEILKSTVSVLIYSCLNKRYRKLFLDRDAVRDLSNVLKTFRCNSLVYRIWKLIRSLVRDGPACQKFIERGGKELILSQLHEDSITLIDTKARPIFIQCVNNCWGYNLYSVDLCAKFFHLLESDDLGTIRGVLCVMSSINTQPRFPFHVTEQGAEMMIKLANHDKDFIRTLNLQCLRRFIQCGSFDLLKEPYRLVICFIGLLKNETISLDSETIKGISRFLGFSNVRNHLKHSQLLPRIVELGIEKGMKFVVTFLMAYQCDEEVIQILARDEKLVPFLLERLRIWSGSSSVLMNIIRRVGVHPALYNEKTLNMLGASNDQSVLKCIVTSSKYAKHLVLSNCIWKLSNFTSLKELGGGDCSELIKSLLQSSATERTTALALPFLVPESDLSKCEEYFVKFSAAELILSALKETPLAPSVVPAVTKLCSVLLNLYKLGKSRNQSHEFIFFLTQPEANFDRQPWAPFEKNTSNCEMISFQLDDGSLRCGPREILAQVSSIFSVMFYGNFVEAGQTTVRFSDASPTAFSALMAVIVGAKEKNTFPISVLLEMIVLADRLLMPGLVDFLASDVDFSGSFCVDIVMWMEKTGLLIERPSVRFLAYHAAQKLATDADTLRTALSITKFRNYLCQYFFKQYIDTYLEVLFNQKLAYKN